MNLKKNKAWKDQRHGFQESLHYLQGRMKGEIKSIQTPWPKFNDAGTDGLEWHSTTVIGGRPASGKTLIKDQIVREAFKLNTGQKFRVLEFQLEMLARTSAIREYSSLLGKTYKHLCSADGKLTNEELVACYNYAKVRVTYPIDIVEHDMLNSLGEALTYLKRKYPIAFIILSQLNRNIDNPERAEDGKYGNYVLESDLFGADALLQHADLLIGINKPGKQNIRYYGPDRYIIAEKDIMVMHFLKCRNGDTRMSFFKTEFGKMQIVEMDTPPTQERRLKT